MSTVLSERFINAFCRLEEELRKITGYGNHESFTFMLDHVSRSNSAFARYREDLKEYAELRNAIVHKRIGDQPIAEPHEDVVERIEAIVEIVTNAPKIENHFRKSVATCSPQDSLKHILELLRNGNFNQLPVYNGKRLVGLLSSDSIALWLADSFQDSEFVDGTTKVKDLLGYTAGRDDFTVLSGASNIFDAIEAFDENYKRGKPRPHPKIISQPL